MATRKSSDDLLEETRKRLEQLTDSSSSSFIDKFSVFDSKHAKQAIESIVEVADGFSSKQPDLGDAFVRQSSKTKAVEEADAQLRNLSLGDRFVCTTCNIQFADRDEQIGHFECDLHLFNMKQKLNSSPVCVPVKEFEQLSGIPRTYVEDDFVLIAHDNSLREVNNNDIDDAGTKLSDLAASSDLVSPESNTKRAGLLQIPQNEKAFLISPPSSPPEGWAPVLEEPPGVNYDLLAALTKLTPDQPFEISMSTSDNVPRILINPCPDLVIASSEGKAKFIPTKRPAYQF